MRQIKIFRLLQRAHAALFRATNQSLKTELGITASQLAVLVELTRKDRSPISAIADELKMGRSSLTQLIDRMTEKGLVCRYQSDQDGRSFEVTIEDKGRRACEAALSLMKGFNAALLNSFSAEESQVIERFLAHLADNAGDIVDAHISSEVSRH